jgi:hypothetical protein
MTFMRLPKPIGIALVLFVAQLSAYSAEVAVLRNGFSIRFERKEITGNVTRLYTGSGFLDVPSEEILSYEAAEDIPVAPLPQPVTPPPQPVAQSSPAPAQAAPMHAAPVALTTPIAQSMPRTPVDLDQVVREASLRHQLDPDFVNSVIKAESNFKTRAVSKKGAQGLMQLMPATASKLGVADPFDPKANVEAGTAHLSSLLDQYHNDPIKALAAYNAGAHRVEQYHGVPPYQETRAYVAKIVHDFNTKKRAQMKAAKPVLSQPKAATTGTTKKKKPQQASVTKPVNPA